MIWNDSDPDYPEPMVYTFDNHLERLLWERDPHREEPFLICSYPDPEGFLLRYGIHERKRYLYMREAAYIKGDKYFGLELLYSHAFLCLCDAWQEEDGLYYDEMDYRESGPQWFLDTLYWKIVSNYLKSQKRYLCENFGSDLPNPHIGQIELHHRYYEVERQGQNIKVPGREHLYHHK